ncbi:two-component system chemotaxis response regulator CheY [Palleronia aestuarii]|uniref:Two-component system chemotaxis response regulator CheY n=1 Tax=Palleronia aestuarii TaxID=568105 RepID=A0A2W7NJ87_9RHOB|nr:response regulator [Palleronia aestuarii]PZX11352.1 two-component system chemotaxis response regulator CheY [Palleronia aestuarii]
MSLKNTLKVLVVDDTSVSRGLVCMSLEEIGLKNVDFCSSGEKAFDIATRQGVHIILCDQNMPGMSGIQLLEKLRMQRATSRVGFILISGSLSKPLLDEARKWGLNNFLAKPFSTAQLKACLQTVTGPL